MFPASTRRRRERRGRRGRGRAFPAWSRRPRRARAAFFFKAADAIERARRADRAGHDAPRWASRCARRGWRRPARLRSSATSPARPTGRRASSTSSRSPNQTLYTLRRPLGVVGLITPWNFPVAIPAWKIAPALIYGNTVVLKLGYEAPLTGLHLAECFAEAGLPAGVLNVAHRRAARRSAPRSSRNPQRAGDLVHRLGAGRPRRSATRRRRGKPRPARARRPQPADRDGRRRPRPRRRGGVRRRLLVGRPEVHRHPADLRPGRGLRRLPRDAARPHRRAAPSAIPPTPRPRSGPIVERRSSSTRSSPAIERGQAEGGTVAAGGERADDDGLPDRADGLRERRRRRLPLLRGGLRPGHLALPLRRPRRGARARERGRVRPLGGDLHARPARRRSASRTSSQAGILHVNSQTAGADVHVPFGGIKSSGCGPARARPRGAGVLHRDRHGLPGRAAWLSACSSRACSAASAPGSPAACSTTATPSSATTSATRAAGSSSCSATTPTGVELVKGDITELAAVERALDEHEITRVVHLAALQVPFVRANPPLGMHVNVAGTVNVFDAVSRRLDRIPASCTRARRRSTTRPTPPPRPSPAARARRRSTASRSSPTRASRGSTAPSAGVPSIGLRPYVVYGPGRDQGMTSGPTVAMLAAARGEPFHIGFSGVAQYDYAPDVARAAVTAAHSRPAGAPSTTRPGVARRRGGRRRRDPAVRARAPRSPGAATRCRSRPSSRRSGSTATSARSRARRSPTGVAATIEALPAAVRLRRTNERLSREGPPRIRRARAWTSSCPTSAHDRDRARARAGRCRMPPRRSLRALREPLAGQAAARDRPAAGRRSRSASATARGRSRGTSSSRRSWRSSTGIVDARRRRHPRRDGHASRQHDGGAARDARRRGASTRCGSSTTTRGTTRRWCGWAASEPDVPVWLNREWVEADVRITTGFVEPHFFAGLLGWAEDGRARPRRRSRRC